MATERLYFIDSALLEFSATIIDARPCDAGVQLVLDKTAFYPTGGGQPHDTGKIAGWSVVDVFEDEAGTIFHVVDREASLNSGQVVRATLDRDRRVDHLQQHSGQHILSQAFVRSCGAETRSFHLGSITSTIDVDLASPTDEHMRAAEEVANSVIFENRPMRVHLLNEEEAERLPLRKESAVRGCIRVIEVKDFDWSPCGGTHATATGQVGLIAIKSFERARKLTRVEFICGRRALADYQFANRTATSVARMFSVERDSAADSVAKAVAENKGLKKRVRELLEIVIGGEADRALAEAEQIAGFKLVRRVFEGRDIEELRMLALRIVETQPAVALLGSNETGTARVVFARSELLTAQNMGELMAETCRLLGGRGGGKPELAQGGGPDGSKLQDAIDMAASKVKAVN